MKYITSDGDKEIKSFNENHKIDVGDLFEGKDNSYKWRKRFRF